MSCLKRNLTLWNQRASAFFSKVFTLLNILFSTGCNIEVQTEGPEEQDDWETSWVVTSVEKSLFEVMQCFRDIIGSLCQLVYFFSAFLAQIQQLDEMTKRTR